MVFPERPTGNAWQLIGNSFNQGAGIVNDFGTQQNALQALVERRTQAALEQKRLEREQAAKDWELEQKKGDEKRASASAEFAKGEVISPTLAAKPELAQSSRPMFQGGPSRAEVDGLTLQQDQLPNQNIGSGDSTALMGQALDQMQAREQNPGRVPRTREEIIQNLTENRQFDELGKYAASTNPLNTIEGKTQILNVQNQATSTRDIARQEHQKALEDFKQGRIDRRQLAAARARENIEIKKESLTPRGAGGLKVEGLSDTETKSIKDIRRTAGLLSRIDIAANNISGLKRGPISGTINGKNPYDADIAQLDKLVNQTVPSLARGVFGEVGVLTDDDVKRYKDMFATIRTDPSVASALMTDLKKTIEDSWYTTLDTYSKSNKNTAGFDPYWTFSDIAKITKDEPRPGNQPVGRSPALSAAIDNSANGGAKIGDTKMNSHGVKVKFGPNGWARAE